jgi:hypothetical protein
MVVQQLFALHVIHIVCFALVFLEQWNRQVKEERMSDVYARKFLK